MSAENGMGSIFSVLGLHNAESVESLCEGMASIAVSMSNRVETASMTLASTLPRLIQALDTRDSPGSSGNALMLVLAALTQVIARGEQYLEQKGLIALAAPHVTSSGHLLPDDGDVNALCVDYATWQEVGKNIIDWSVWGPELDKANRGLLALRDNLIGVETQLRTLKTILPDLAAITTSGSTGASGPEENVLGGVATLGDAIEGWPKVGVMSLAGKLSYIGLLLEIEEKVVKPLEHKFTLLVDNPLSQTLNGLPGSESVRDIGASVRTQLFGDLHLHAGNEGLLPTRTSGEPLPVTQHAQAAHRAAHPPETDDVDGLRGRDADVGASAVCIASLNQRVEGLQALVHQLRSYVAHGRRAVVGMLPIGTSFVDGNTTSSPLMAISRQFGVPPETLLNLSHPPVLSALLGGYLDPDNGRNLYAVDLTGFPETTHIAGSHIEQQNTYHIYGGNAQEVGNEVGRRQLDANSRIMRTSQNRRG